MAEMGVMNEKKKKISIAMSTHEHGMICLYKALGLCRTTSHSKLTRLYRQIVEYNHMSHIYFGHGNTKQIL